jgi:hypothetical protein
MWMACELMTFGAMFTLFRGVETPVKQAIAAGYGVADRVLDSWLATFNQVRNLCAHHARLWNRAFGVRPQIPRPNRHPDWHHPVPITNDRLFGVMTVLNYLLRQIAPQSHWRQRWENLLALYPEIPIAATGFPANWKESPFWQTLALPPTPAPTPAAPPAPGGPPSWTAAGAAAANSMPKTSANSLPAICGTPAAGTVWRTASATEARLINSDGSTPRRRNGNSGFVGIN